MKIHISYKNLKSSEVEQEFAQLAEKLKKRLLVYRADLVHLHGSVEQSAPRRSVTVTLNLRLPTGQLAAHASAAKAVPTVRAAFTELIKQLTRHKELLRSNAHRSSHGNGESKQLPFDKALVTEPPARAKGASISAYLDDNLAPLQRFIERELQYRENNGQLPADQVTSIEILDEVVATALDGQQQHKPQMLSMQRWMYRLALQALQRATLAGDAQRTAVPLEQSARKQNNKASDEPELQFHQPDEMLHEEDVIADRRAATPEDIAASDEMVALVEHSLRQAKPADREAFILYAIEGFTYGEIAVITDCRHEQVKASVDAARECLKKSLPAPSPLHERLLKQPARIA